MRTGDALAYASLLLGAAASHRIRSRAGILLGPAKVLGSALCPFVAAGGALGAALGLISRRLGAVATGAAGALLAARHARRLAASRGNFRRAFAADRERPIPEPRHAQQWGGRPPGLPEPRWVRDVPFATIADRHGRPRDLLCNLWQPPDGIEPTGLAVIYLHGGAWFLGDRDLHIGPPWLAGNRTLLWHLAAQGHLVMDAGYRLFPEADVFGMLADVKRAIAWVKENAAGNRVYPERVVVAGDSAGGHLALLAAYTPTHPALTPEELAGRDLSVRAVVSYYGVTDLRTLCAHVRPLEGDARGATDALVEAAVRLGIRLVGPDSAATALPPGPVTCRQVLTHLLGAPPEQVPVEMALASPITHVAPGCPPTLLFHGAHDSLVPVSAARALRDALTDAGVPAVYLELPEVEHGYTYVLPDWSPAVRATLRDTGRFLALLV